MVKTLKLSRLHKLDAAGCEILLLALIKDGVQVAAVEVRSGGPGHQNFRTLANQMTGCNEPIPEGIYDDLGPVEWAGGKGNWGASWGPGLGPAWVELYQPREIGLHLDANRQFSPGSAGCVVAIRRADLEKILSWWEGQKPSRLVVDWGLGSIHAN